MKTTNIKPYPYRVTARSANLQERVLLECNDRFDAMEMFLTARHQYTVCELQKRGSLGVTGVYVDENGNKYTTLTTILTYHPIMTSIEGKVTKHD